MADYINVETMLANMQKRISANGGIDASPGTTKRLLLTSFNYEVSFIGKRRVAHAGFSAVSGLRAQLNVIQVPEGGVNDQPHRIPKGITYQPILCERGLSFDYDLMNVFSGQYNDSGVISVAEDNLMIVRVRLKDRGGSVRKVWEYRDVLIETYEVSDMNAMSSALALERIGFTFRDVDIY
jgi:phage tail-like protein